MKPLLCIYHAPCLDGFAAAWAVWKAHPETEFVPAKYGDDPPDVTGRDVVLVDFCYKRPTLEAMLEKAKSLLVLDHHASAERDLKPFRYSAPRHFDAVLDLQHSGAMIAWNWFHPSESAPMLIHYVEDADLHEYRYAETKFYVAALASYPYNFGIWSFVAEMRSLVEEGRSIVRRAEQDLELVLEQTKRNMVIGGFLVPVANVPYYMATAAGNRLARGAPFAATYFDSTNGRKFSLRSTPDDLGSHDVSKIAEQYGGGGHKYSAGFLAPRNFEGDSGGE